MLRQLALGLALSGCMLANPTKAHAADPNTTIVVVGGVEYLYFLYQANGLNTVSLIPLGPAAPAVPTAAGGAVAGGLPVVILGSAVAIGLAGTYLYYITQLANATNQGDIGEPANNPTDYEVNYWTQFTTFYSG